MKHGEYWKQRFEQMEQAQNKRGASTYANIERQYRQAQKQLEGQITAWYGRFADNNSISMAEARKRLSGKELEEFKWDVQDYIKYGEENALNGQWMKQLENASARYHVSRLEAIKLQTQNSLEVMFGNQLDTVDGAMRDIYASGYYHTAYEIQKGIGVGWDFASLDNKQISKVINSPWAADGKNFSERIWGNRRKLVNELETTLTQNIMLGKDPQKAIDEIARKMGVSKKNASRLVMTEEAYFSSAAQKDCFNELDVEQYEIVATLDSHTSELCQSLDGKVFDMKDYEPGVTAPPFHVWCRSTTVPYFDDDYGQVGERAARDEDGKTYYVPESMKYSEWKETFVDGGDKSGLDIASEPPPPKKEYLTKKKLQANIADADIQLANLCQQEKDLLGGTTYDELVKDYGSIDKAYGKGVSGDDLIEKEKLIEIHNQVTLIEQKKLEWEELLDKKLFAEQSKALMKEEILLQERVNGFTLKTYSGIWKDDVTTSDWIAKKDFIQSKKEYLESELLHATNTDGENKWRDLIQQLEEFDKEGKSFYEAQSQLKKVQADLTALKSNGTIKKSNPLAAYTQERKDAALWAKSAEEADDRLRDVCGQAWQGASNAERDSIHEYTQDFQKFNDPLRGIEYGSSNFLGVGNVDLEQIGVAQGKYQQGQVKKQIDAMTSIIEKSTYPEDIWVQRGCGYGGMDKLFGISANDFNLSESELANKLMLKRPTEYGFFSTGASKGKGFSSKPIILNVYAPAGTKMMYAEPFSAFGSGGKRNWDGISKQASFGSEAEVILQRGTTFQITKVEKSNGKIYIDMEVVNQEVH